MEKNIIVNATALSTSGALTILKQFIKNTENHLQYHFICFIPCDLNLIKPKNVTFIEIPKMNWLKRVLWDSFKLKAWLSNRDIKPHKVISLQNTSINIDADQIIYLHQPLPFSEVSWSIFKKEEFKLFLYKYFYSLFIFFFVKESTVFVVQTNWMKDALSKKFGIPEGRIETIKPEVIFPSNIVYNTEVKSSGCQKLLYPAVPVFYKNHTLILDAMKYLKGLNKLEKSQFQVTFKEGDYPLFDKIALEHDLVDFIEYLGVLPYEELMGKYLGAKCILFPSYVETYGLPLAEAAYFGKKVLCSDIAFAHDVLEGYSGAVFLDYKNSKIWGDAISKVLSEDIADDFKINKSGLKEKTGWNDFFNLI